MFDFVFWGQILADLQFPVFFRLRPCRFICHTGTKVYSQPSAFLQSAWPPRGPGKQHAAHPSRNLLRYPPGAAFGGAPRALRALGRGDI